MKDYYKIIDVPYDASPEEIRRAYHKQAKKFHPDKNPGKANSAVFLDIQEAYHVLSDERRRQAFHLTTHYPLPGRKREEPETVYSILEKCKLLNQKVRSTNRHRINPAIIAKTIEALLSEKNGAIILKESKQTVTADIVQQLLQSLKVLPYNLVVPNISKLLRLVGNNTALQQQIIEFGNKKKKLSFWERYNFIIISLAAILICLLIFLLA